MQFDTDSIEKLAREYNQALSSYEISDNASNLIERIIGLSENQLDIINCMLCQPQSKYCAKILNYLKTLITSSIIALNRLLNRGEYIPPFRNPPRCCQNYTASFMQLVEIQLDIFVLLDKLSQYRGEPNILILENRVMSIISVICR